jgi:hypothetical protein
MLGSCVAWCAPHSCQGAVILCPFRAISKGHQAKFFCITRCVALKRTRATSPCAGPRHDLSPCARSARTDLAEISRRTSSRRDFLMVRAGAIEASNPRAIFSPAHKTAFATGGAGPGLPLHTQHALHTFSSLRRTLPCRPPNPDTHSHN